MNAFDIQLSEHLNGTFTIEVETKVLTNPNTPML